jgi:hypothetical protein
VQEKGFMRLTLCECSFRRRRRRRDVCRLDIVGRNVAGKAEENVETLPTDVAVESGQRIVLKSCCQLSYSAEIS